MYMLQNEHVVCLNMAVREMVNKLCNSWYNTLHKNPLCLRKISRDISKLLLDSGDEITEQTCKLLPTCPNFSNLR